MGRNVSRCPSVRGGEHVRVYTAIRLRMERKLHTQVVGSGDGICGVKCVRVAMLVSVRVGVRVVMLVGVRVGVRVVMLVGVRVGVRVRAGVRVAMLVSVRVSVGL
eukprot:1723287-Pleurochrysis_carterae.AAC.4